MIMSFPGLPRDNLLFIDVEFDGEEILQVAGLLFSRVHSDLYQLKDSYNIYACYTDVSYYAAKYTGLDAKFLQEHGLSKGDFQLALSSKFSQSDSKNTMLISHGVRNDRKVLRDYGIQNLPAHSFCTFKNAGKILKRKDKLSLSDIAYEAGLRIGTPHNAAFDAMATAAACSFLLSKRKRS